MTPKRDFARKIISLLFVIGLLIGGGITIFAEESVGETSAMANNADVNLFLFLYNTLKSKSGDIFSLLAAAVSLTVFLLVKQYLIPLLNRVLKSLMPEEKEKKDKSFDDEE